MGALEPGERLVVVGSYQGQRDPVVATLVNDPSVAVTLPPPAEAA